MNPIQIYGKIGSGGASTGTISKMDAHALRERETTSGVKGSILIPFAIVLAVVVGAFLIFVYIYLEKERERELRSNVQSVERLFHQEIERDVNMMRAILDSVTLNSVAKRAFLRGDRRTVLQEVMPLFDSLRISHHITRLFVTRPDHTVFLRAHRPDKYGDSIGGVATLEAKWTGQGAQGIELGPAGTLTLRSVIPWRDRGRLIGYLELTKDLDHIIRDVNRVLGVDLVVLVYKRFLDRQEWQSGRKMLGLEANWDEYDLSVGAGRTMAVVPQALAQSLASHERHRYGAVIPMTEGGKFLYVAFLPLFDVADREIGDLVVVRDVTKLQAAFRDSLSLVVSLCLFAGAEVFILLFYILNKVELERRRQRQVEMQFSKLSAEHQQIVQTEKLSAIGLMIGEIAHQLNNPLVGVINIAQLAERDVDDSKRTRELLGEIRKAGEGCRDFVRRMLEFTRISRFDRKPTDLVQLIRETLALFQQTAAECPSLIVDLPEVPIVLDVDPVLIRHAIFNLLTNAQQALADTPDATITIRLVPDTKDGDSTLGWRLSIADNGPGLSAEARDKLFTPFFSTRAEGTGLGLPVVQQIAVSHEGQITVTDNPGGGAHFALWLPDSGSIWDETNETEDPDR